MTTAWSRLISCPPAAGRKSGALVPRLKYGLKRFRARAPDQCLIEDGIANVRSCAGFRIPASESRATSTGGRHPKPAKERTRGGDAPRGPRTPLWRFGCGGTCERECVGLFKVVDHALVAEQPLGLMVEIIVESSNCGRTSPMGGRTCASMVAAGPQPAPSEVVIASSQDSNRRHDVSILMALIGPVGR